MLIFQRRNGVLLLSSLVILVFLTKLSISFIIAGRTKNSCIHFGKTTFPCRKHKFSYTKNIDGLRMTTEGNDETAVKLQEALRLKEQANAAREKVLQIEREYTEEKIQTLEAKLKEATTAAKRKGTNSSVTATSKSPLDEQSLQEKIDNLKSYLESNGTLTTIGTAPVSLATQENKDKRENNTEIVAIDGLSEEESKFISDFESSMNDFSDRADDDILSKIFTDTVAGEMGELMQNLKGGNLTSEEKKDIVETLTFVDDVLNISGGEILPLMNSTFDALEDLKEDPLSEFRNRFPLLMENELTYKVNESDVQSFVDNVLLKVTDRFEMNGRPRKIGNNYIIVGKPVGDAIKDGNILLSRLDEEVGDVIKKSTLSSNSNFSTDAEIISNLQYFYIRDPQILNELMNDEIAMSDMIMPSNIDPQTNTLEFFQAMLDNFENLEATALLITHKEVKEFIDDDSNDEDSDDILSQMKTDYDALAVADNFLSALAILGTANFAADCYQKDNILFGFTTPIFWGMVALILVKQFGHTLAATFNKLEVSLLPMFTPSLDIGLVAATNRLEKPAKDNKQIFDYASSGPLLSITASWLMLVYGLLLTARTVQAEQIAALPHVPLQFLQLSLLTSSTIQTFLGTDVLLSLDPTTAMNTVAIHPLVLAAHLGLLMNGLALLPISTNSDGGRMLLAAFSRISVFAVIITSFLTLFLIAQGVHEWGTSSFLFAYLFFQGDPKDVRLSNLPARNDVDPAGSTRQILLGIYTTLAIVVLSPSF